ncbi:MAG: PQQ-binding-like beta-propeller repeat protein [Planctomycetes bacterium]|nr:PQQ-binding-like beta-propeller repeat protein [Planctomycetota bacterium]
MIARGTLLGALVLAGAASAPAQDASPEKRTGDASAPLRAAWPEYRGPQRNGVVDGELPLHWSESSGVRWKTAIAGRGWSTPVVSGERIWLSTADDEGHHLRALEIDAASGAIRREIELFEIAEPQHRNALNSYASPSPVSDGERVVFHFGAHGTVCLDVATGERLWERTDLVCDHMEGPGSSPLLHGESLVLLFDGGDVQFATALDVRSGKTLWKRERGVDYQGISAEARKAFSTPVLIEREGRTELVASCALATMGYEPSTGAELWRVAHPGFSMSARPVYADGVLILSTGFMRPEWWAVRCGPAPATGEDDRVHWRHRRGVPTMPSPILHAGLLFFASDQGTVSCLEAVSGKEIWSERMLGPTCASPLLANGKLLFCDREGKSIVLEAGREPKILAENHLDAGCYASPVLLGSVLFLRTATDLYRVEPP